MIKPTLTVFFTLLFVNLALSLNYYGVREDCLLDRDRGEVCSNGTQPKIMYHFDKFTKRCLLFKYNGCGGNDNRFKDEFECWNSCLPTDYFSCALSTDPYKNEKGEEVSCGFPATEAPENNQECPADYVCILMFPVGRCCDKKAQERFGNSFITKCPYGDANGLGKSCDDDFCPSNHTCHQGEIFAHCCPN